jgi:peptidoglycan/LPS O-acetylase OafA/YrhL
MIRSLEGGRGAAALIVALYHLGLGLDQFGFIRNGYIFVDLFFVLSGFVIAASYLNRLNTGTQLRSFFVRRFGRLFPLLIFSTLVFVLLQNAIVLAKRLAAANGYGEALNNPGALEFVLPTASEIMATLTMTHSLGLFEDLILNTPSWSISTEFYTYLLFAVVCFLIAGRMRLATFFLLSAGAFAVAVWASITVHDCLNRGGCMSVTYDYGFPRTVFSFFLGALVYHASNSIRFDTRFLQWIGLLLLVVLFSSVDNNPALAFAFPFVFAILILSCCQDSGPLATFLNTKPLQMLGQRSYSIYLLHMPLILVFGNVAKRVDGTAATLGLVAVFVVTLIVISGWTYRFVEDPLRVRFNRLASDPGTLPATPQFSMPKKMK